MAFNAGELVATIRLDGVDKFRSDAQSAGDSLSRAGQAGQKVGGLIKGGMNIAAGSITATTVAATAYVTSLFKTGAAYNTLQQTSRAALKTILGSTEAVNDQMAQLDDFARNSPFSKSTFLQAQQQLLGFGIEAGKVIPILSAVQDATAAVGGANQQISEIVSIFAKISSSGKITAEDLNMLGERGLDAATLLGEGFGQSASEIRESITKGTIDAGRAVDVLTEQMSEKFGGAAANVKETWSGAVDRITAANREIGASLAEPFISQQGGGMAITWANQYADVLRAVLKHTQPVVSIMTERLAPAFAGITTGLDKARVVISAWDSSQLESFLNHAEVYAPAIAALGGAVTGWASSMLGGIPIIGSFVGALNPLTGALGAVALASPEVRGALMELSGAFGPMMSVAGDLAKLLASGLGSALPLVAAGIGAITAVASPLVGILGQVPTPVLAAAVAFLALRTNMGGVSTALQRFGEQMALQRGIAAATGGELGATSRQVGFFGAAAGAASAKISGLSLAMKNAFMSNPIGIALTGISVAVAAVTAAMAAAQEKTREYEEGVASLKGTLDDVTGAATAATREVFAQALVDDGWIEKLDEVGISSQRFTDALMGNQAAIAMVRQELQSNIQAHSEEEEVLTRSTALAERLGVSHATMGAALRGSKAEYEEVILAIDRGGESSVHLAQRFQELQRDTEGAGTAAGDLVGYLDEQAAVLAEAQDQAQQYREALRGAQEEMGEAARSAQRIDDALAILRDTSSDAASKLSALKSVLNELNGGAKSQEQALRDYHEQVENLADAFEKTNDAGENLAKGLIDQSGSIDTTTQAGRALFDQVTALNDAYLDEVIAADAAAKARGETGVSVEAAREIYSRYEGQLREAAAGAGVADEAVDGLITTMLSTPEVVAFAVDDSGTVDANKLRLINLATQILATPDGEFNVTEDDIPGLMAALEALGYKTETLPDGTVVVDDGSVQTAIGALSHLHSQIQDRTMTITTRMREIVERIAPAPQHQGTPLLPGSANGNLFAGGSALAFANGAVVHRGLQPAIYKGRPQAIHKFAEMETRWEAYISGKAGQEKRNRAIAAEAVRRLGGFASFDPTALGGPPRAFANGGILDTQRQHSAAVEKEYSVWKQWQEVAHRAAADPKAEWLQDLDKEWKSKWEDAKREREQLASALKSETDRLVGTQQDWFTDLRRGKPQQQGMNGGGLQLVDKLMQTAEDTGGKSGDRLMKIARDSETSFLRLEKQAKQAETAISAAEDRKSKLVDEAETAKTARVRKAEEEKSSAVDKAERERSKLVAAAEARRAAAVKAAEKEKSKLVESAERVKTKLVDAAEVRAAARVKSATERADALVEKVTSKWNAAVEKASAKLDDLRAASDSMASAVAGTIRSKFDLGVLATATTRTRTITEKSSQSVGGTSLSSTSQREVDETVPVTKASIKSGLWGQAKSAKALASKIKRLGQMGFTASFIREVMALGIDQAEPMIDALLTMSKADVADVNSLHKTINQAAASTGNQIADRYYAQSITTAEKQLAATEAKAEKAIANAEKQASRIISNAEKWGQWQINTAKAEGDRQIRAAEQRGNRAVWVAKQEGDRAVWVAKQEGDRRVRKATIEGDRAIRKATIEGDRAIRAAKNEGDRQIRAAQNDAAAIQRKLKAETDRVVNAITKALKNPWDMEFKVEVKVGNEPPVVSKPKLNAGNNSPKVTLPKVNVGVVKRAFGGPIIGPGGPRSDLVPLWASNDEHMNAASEVQGAGGHENVYKIRAAMADGTLRRLLDSPAVGLRGDGPMVRVPVGAAQAAQPVQVAVEAPPAIFPEKFELVLDSGETLRGVIRQEASGVVSEQEERRRRRVVQGRQVR